MIDATVLYYTREDMIAPELAELCLQQLIHSSPHAIVVSKSVPTDPRSLRGMYATMMRGLSDIHSEHVYCAEHDVLYPPSHFDRDEHFARTMTPAYDIAVWTMDTTSAWYAGRRVLSSLLAHTQSLRVEIARRITVIDRGGKIPWAEPWRVASQTFGSLVPCIDIRHGCNLTGARGPGIDAKQYPPGWDHTVIDRVREIIRSNTED